MSIAQTDKIILYDVTRLINRRRAVIPTGIDRIDLQLAIAVFERFGPACLPVVQVGEHTTVMEKERQTIIEMLQGLKSTWFGEGQPNEQVASRLGWLGVTTNAGVGAKKVETEWKKSLSPKTRLLFETGNVCLALNQILGVHRFGAEAPDFASANSIVYVNSSHQGVVRTPKALARLAGDRELKIVAYIHDIMPIEIPEYTRVDQIVSLKAFLFELMQHPVAFAVNSKATATSLFAFMTSDASGEINARNIAAPQVIYPGVELINQPSPIERSDRLNGGASPSFVILGTVEPRKNHLMLLQIWRQLAIEKIEPMPHLHIIGRRGWAIENVTAMLDRCGSIKPHVSEHNDLDDAEVRRYLRSSRALLFPSFAEGLGLPLVEAAQLGVPVIASDIPVFREIVAGGVEFISPLDALGWNSAIKRATQIDGELSPPRLRDEFKDWTSQSNMFADFVGNM